MTKLPFRTVYSVVDDCGLECKDPSLAQQNGKDDADINVLMERFRVTGNLPVSAVPPQYGDFSAVSDYRSALEALMNARDYFMTLPGAVRARFSNDPGAFATFASDPANIEAMREMGLAPAKPAVGGIGGSAPDAKPGGEPKA